MSRRRSDRWNGATETKRTATQREKCIAFLATLKGHAEYQRIFNFTWSILNLASCKSSMGQEDRAKELQKKLLKALKKIASGSLNRQLPASELALEETQ